MPVIKTNNGSAISYTDSGSGYPILFLHGWMMSQKVWHFQQSLSSGFRIITMDIRGHGKSIAPDFSYADCITDITELLDYLNIERTIVVGWSMGSQIAIKAHAVWGHRMSGMVLVGGTPRFCSTEGYAHGLTPTEARGMTLRLKRNYPETAGHFFQRMFSPAEAVCNNLVDLKTKTVSNLPPLAVSLSALDELVNADLRQMLSEISQPVLLLHGTADTICPPGASEFMANHLRGAIIKLFIDKGHAPFMSVPERFNAELAGFVRAVNG